MKNIVFTLLFFLPLSEACIQAAEIDTVAIVAAHNQLRADIGVSQKLVYSEELAAKAQAWVDNLKQTNRCQMQHSKTEGKYGENLYWGSAISWTDGRKEMQRVSSEQVVHNWGSEKKDYDYATNQCKAGKICGHYTQIVWRSTRLIGCGLSVCEDTLEQVWSCQYQPAGNWVGEKTY